MPRLIAITVLLACLPACGTLNEPGVDDRLMNLIDYTTPDNMGPAYYSDKHYDGPNPVTDLRDELRPDDVDN